MKKILAIMSFLPFAFYAQQVEPLTFTMPKGASARLGAPNLIYSKGISDLATTPAGELIVSNGKWLDFWNLADCSPIRRITLSNNISCVNLSKDGNILLVTHGGKNVSQLELSSYKMISTFETQPGAQVAVFSPDNARCLVTYPSTGVFAEIDLNAGKELWNMKCNMHMPMDAIYGKDGKSFFTHGSNGSGPVIASYSITKQKIIAEWHKDYYSHSRSLRLSEDGERLLAGTRHSATEWQVGMDGNGSYKLLGMFSGHHGHAATNVSYIPQCPELILTGSRDGSVRLWNRINGKLIRRWCPHGGHVVRLIASQDGKLAVSYGGGTISVNKIVDGLPVMLFNRHTQSVNAMKALDAKTIVSGGSDSRLICWNAVSQKCISDIVVPGLGIYALAVSPDKTKIAAGCKDGKIFIYSFTKAQLSLVKEITAFRGYVRSMKYLPNGLLAASGDDGTVKIWNTENEKPQAILDGHRGGVLCIDVSPDGTILASGGRDATLRIWSLDSYRQLFCTKAAKSWISDVAFSNDGQSIWTAAYENAVTRWDAKNYNGKVFALNMMPRTIAFNSDASPIIGLANGDLCILIPESGEAKHIAESAHSKTVNAVVYLPEIKSCASASEDCDIFIWPLK